MNAHQNTLLLGAGDNNALWLLQRKAQAHHEMRERLRHHVQAVGKHARQILTGFRKKLPLAYFSRFFEHFYGIPDPFGPAVAVDAKKRVSNARRALENTAFFRATKELTHLIDERRREWESLSRQKNLVKLKTPGSEGCIKLKKLHATSLSIPPSAAPRFSFR